MLDFIQKFRHGDAVFRVLNVDNVNRIIDVLVGLKGDGCLIEKPLDAEGRNWKIIFDKRRSDTPGGSVESEGAADDVKPLDYLIRFVAGNPRESQYGDFAAQTDFYAQSAASAQWLRDTMIPLGYGYLTFTPSGGESNTARSADSLAAGFSLKAGYKGAGKLFRLAHGNQHAAMMMEGDGDSIEVDCKSYANAPAYILKGWNADDNYITIPKSTFESQSNPYAFLTYDTYLPGGQRRIDHPAEIKFANLNKAFFEDFVVFVSNITIEQIDIYLCELVMRYCFTHGEFTKYHWKCLTTDSFCLGTPGEPGTNGGGWMPVGDLADGGGAADADDLSDLLAAVTQLAAEVDGWADIQSLMTSCDNILAQIGQINASFTAYEQNLAAWDADLDAAITSLRQTAAALDRLESTATSQRARVDALMQSAGA